MAKATLVETDIREGAKLYKVIEKAGLGIALAAWLRLSGENEIRLYFAIPDVEIIGPFEAY